MYRKFVGQICVAVAVVLTIMLPQKICYTTAKSLPHPSATHTQGKIVMQPQSTSYYRREPYGPNTYAFGFEVNDNLTGNVQFRDERRYQNGSVEGSYGFVRADGRVTVTHFLADAKMGYKSQMETFESGETHKWQQHWPTKKPNMWMESHGEVVANVTYDEKHHLNLTEDHIPMELANAVRQQHGLDVNAPNLQQNLIDPTLLSIINGHVPLQQNPAAEDDSLGYKIVHNFIPKNFPIAPFELPAKLEEELQPQMEEMLKNERKDLVKHNGTNVRNEDELYRLTKYDDATGNNDKKSLNDSSDALVKPTIRIFDGGDMRVELPKPLTDSKESADNKKAWYQSLIDEIRKDFLQNLPSLA